MRKVYQVSESAVFRNLSDEVVVIQLDSGKFYHFNEEMGEFLGCFQSPTDLEDYLKAHELEENPVQVEYIKGFCKFLQAHSILEEVDEKAAPIESAKKYSQPKFKKEGEKDLADMVFLCP